MLGVVIVELAETVVEFAGERQASPEGDRLVRQVADELAESCAGTHCDLSEDSRAMAVRALIDTLRRAPEADPRRLAALLRHEAGPGHDGQEFCTRLSIAVCDQVAALVTRGSPPRTAVVDNRLGAEVAGSVLQAGAVHGNVTINHHWSFIPPPVEDAGTTSVERPGTPKAARPYGDPWWICTGATAGVLSAAVLVLLGGLLGQAAATGVVTGLLVYLAASTTALVTDR